jgi:hypothetical protein
MSEKCSLARYREMNFNCCPGKESNWFAWLLAGVQKLRGFGKKMEKGR